MKIRNEVANLQKDNGPPSTSELEGFSKAVVLDEC